MNSSLEPYQLGLYIEYAELQRWRQADDACQRGFKGSWDEFLAISGVMYMDIKEAFC